VALHHGSRFLQQTCIYLCIDRRLSLNSRPSPSLKLLKYTVHNPPVGWFTIYVVSLLVRDFVPETYYVVLQWGKNASSSPDLYVSNECLSCYMIAREGMTSVLSHTPSKGLLSSSIIFYEWSIQLRHATILESEHVITNANPSTDQKAGDSTAKRCTSFPSSKAAALLMYQLDPEQA